MKKILYFLAFAALCVSCNVTKEFHSSDVDTFSSVDSTDIHNAKTVKNIDTTTYESGKVTITKVEFYPPSCTPAPANNNIRDGDVKNTNNDTLQSPIAIPDISHLTNSNNNQGAVKSIEQIVFEGEHEKRGQSNESSEVNDSTNTTAIKDEQSIVKDESELQKDPFRWRYIAVIVVAVLIAVAFLVCYIKKTPAWSWFTGILAKIFRK